MKKLHIAIQTKTGVITALQKLYNVTFYQKQTFWQKLFLQDPKYPDVYFHQGVLNSQALDLVEESKMTVVNAKGLKEQILEKKSYLKREKIEVLYPYITTSLEYSKELKKEFRELHNIDKETRILLFSAGDIILGGIDKFLEIVQNLENKNYLLLFDIKEDQQSKLQEKLMKYKLNEKVLEPKQSYSKDHYFMVSDIYICPTNQTLFNPNVQKAMYLRNAVFVMRENFASEIIDSFSLILGVDDRSIYFKVDALLANKKELKTIQKENYLVVKNMVFERYLEELQEHISFHCEI